MLTKKIKESDILLFCRQLSTMINAGLNIVKCFEILYIQQENIEFKKILNGIKKSLESGGTLSDSFGNYPKIFDPLFVNMVSAGETSGSLDTILKKLSDHKEKTARLKARVKGSLVYPAVTMISAIIVVSLIMIFVVPVFQAMFADFGSALPVLTLFTIELSQFLRENFFFIAGSILLFVCLFKILCKTENGRHFIDSLRLKAPIFGKIARKIAIARFAQTTGTMVGSGVPILESLKIASGTAGNKVLETACLDTRKQIEEGISVADSLEHTGFFPQMVCQMVAVGELTGDLDIMLNRIADFYEQEADRGLDNLTALIEPLMMIFMGVIIGGLVVSMYLPIFSIAGAIGT